MTLVIAALSPGVPQAQPALQSPCATVAQAVLAAKPSGEGWRGPWGLPIETLSKMSGGLVVVDADGWRAESEQAALDKLRELRASPGLQNAIRSLTNGNWLFSVHLFGRSSLRMAQVMEGTLHCRRFAFFDTPPAGADTVTAPPITRTEEGKFCWTRSAYAGEVAGAPAFIAQDDLDNSVRLSITSWRNGQWETSCKVAIEFTPTFEVVEQLCRGVDCTTMATQALADAEATDRGVALAEDQTESFKTMKKLAETNPPNNDLRTLGDSFTNAYSEFAPNSVLIPVTIGGETFLGRIGHAALGWRVSADYLFAAYKTEGSELEPIAAVYIRKTRGKPARATVE